VYPDAADVLTADTYGVLAQWGARGRSTTRLRCWIQHAAVVAGAEVGVVKEARMDREMGGAIIGGAIIHVLGGG